VHILNERFPMTYIPKSTHDYISWGIRCCILIFQIIFRPDNISRLLRHYRAHFENHCFIEYSCTNLYYTSRILQLCILWNKCIFLMKNNIIHYNNYYYNYEFNYFTFLNICVGTSIGKCTLLQTPINHCGTC